MSRVMIAGTGSGSGKTTIVCGLCQCIKNMGKVPAALKCGPDYIDSMFHSRVLNMRTGNLDSWFCDDNTIRYLLGRQEDKSDITIIEGVMGYYDGQGFSTKGSSYEIADITDTPVILVVNCRGMSNSIGAMLKGYKEYHKDSHIQGVIFNNLSSRLYASAAETARQAGIRPLGYMPYSKEVTLESRHLGLVTTAEVLHFQDKVDKIAEVMEKTVDIEGILELADSAAHITELQTIDSRITETAELQTIDSRITETTESRITETAESQIIESRITEKTELQTTSHPVLDSVEYDDTIVHTSHDYTDEDVIRKIHPRIAVARDKAFCFLYEDNLEYLRRHGCELVYFSPMTDEKLPDDIDGMLLYGGYPELYAKELSDNVSMRVDIARMIKQGLPCIAECGGFLYLHQYLETPEGDTYPMAGIIEGKGYGSGRLARFGYMTLTAAKDTLLANKGESFLAHEFHYWKSDSTVKDYKVVKASDASVEYAGYGSDTLYAAFPHIYFYGNRKLAEKYISRCRDYHYKRVKDDIADRCNDNYNKNCNDMCNENYNGITVNEKTAEDKIKPIDMESVRKSISHWNGIAKPIHGLGLMEDMIAQIAGIRKNADVNIDKKAVIVMCADNGIVEEGVTQTGQEVTAVVSCNMADGISSVCRMAERAGVSVIPVNIGIASECEHEGLINRCVMHGTKNFLKEPAMSYEQAVNAVNTGISIVKQCSKEGYDIIATGEMGIGNTTTSTALACILLDLAPDEVTGRGAGLDDAGLSRKIEVISKAKTMYGIYKDNPMELLRCIGGLDIAGLVGVCLGGAVYGIPVVIDGVISAVAAVIATSLCPDVSGYIIVSHQGKEPAMKALLARLDKKAVIHADLALGEGTGAVMLFPLLDMALQVYKENTTFDDIQITAYEDYEKC